MFGGFGGLPDWFWWYFIAQYVGMGLVGGYIVYHKYFKIAFKAVFVREAGSVSLSASQILSRQQNSEESKNPRVHVVNVSGKVVKEFDSPKIVGSGKSYEFVGEKEFKASQSNIDFAGGSYRVDLSFPSFRSRGWTTFYYDFESGNLLNFGGEMESVSPKVLVRHVAKSVWERILIAVNGLPKMFVWMILGLLVACIVGGLIGGYLLGEYLTRNSYVGWVPNETVEMIGGVLFGLW